MGRNDVVGLAEGCFVGLADGMRVGWSEGCWDRVGGVEGVPVGRNDGNEEGTNVGLLDCVGMDEMVGDWVGIMVGAGVSDNWNEVLSNQLLAFALLLLSLFGEWDE